MLWILVIISLVSLNILYRFTRSSGIHQNRQKLQRPSDTLPLLGNAIRFLQPRHVLFSWFISQHEQFGDSTFEISVPSLPPGVVITSPANLEFVLKNESLVTKGPFFRDRSWDLFGHGIINATGPLWRAQRKAGLKFFSGDNLSELISFTLPATYAKTRSKLLSYTQNRGVFDLEKLFLDFTTITVGRIAYDMPISASSPFSTAFDYASDHIALRFQNPLYRITELFTGSHFRSCLAEVKSFGRTIVKAAHKRRSQAAFSSLVEGNAAPAAGSLIDSLIEAFDNDDIVADAAMNFLSAGRDTTAQSLTWTFYAIMRHPQVIPKLRAEIDSVFPKLSTPSPDNDSNEDEEDNSITLSHLTPTTLPYLFAIYYESLRLYPPVPIEIKQTTTSLHLPDNTFLPAHSIIVWSIWAMNRSPQLYGNDAHLFRPERWLDTNGKFVRKSEYEFPVFNGGPRACLGKRMAEVMAAWVLVKCMGEFEFEEVVKDGQQQQQEEERRSQNSLTLPMEGGLPVRVRLRQR